MPIDVGSLPAHLKLEKPKPKKFSDVLADLSVNATYKVTAMSVEAFSRQYRVVHQYYIGLQGNDPSNIRKLMSTLGVGEQKTWEDGKQQESITGFTFLVPMQELTRFRNSLRLAIDKQPGAYVAASYHNLVQYSYISGDYTTFTSLPLDE